MGGCGSASGVGWQESEFDALEEDFSNRGKRMDEALHLLRAYWGDDKIDYDGAHYSSTAMAMEPKPPQGRDLPIWIGGGSGAALRRVAELGDGWMGTATADDDQAARMVARIHEHATEIGRDPAEIGLQMQLQSPPASEEEKTFYADHDRVVARAETIATQGYDWLAINATAIFQAGARSVDAIVEQLDELHGKLRAATD